MPLDPPVSAQAAADSAGEPSETSPQTRRDLSASVADAGTFNVMVGLGETYIAPFAVALGTGGISTGLLTTVPIFAGSLLQLITPHAVRRIGSHRKWVVACAVMQALSLLLMPLAILLGGWGAALVYAAATFYWGSGQAGAPSWNTWIEDLVPIRVRTRFFAWRGRVSQICLLAAFVLGGIFLHIGKTNDWTMVAFTCLFVAATFSRLASAYFLAVCREPNAGKLHDEHITLRQWSSRLKEHSGARLLVFLFAMQASVYISGPYFTPYMLRELGLSYFGYMLLVSICLVGKAVALPFWGRFAHRYGAKRLLWVGACAILPLSSLWIISREFWLCASIQLLSGLTWAAFELAIVLMFFEAIPRHERASLVTIYNVSNSGAMISGTVLGAFILSAFNTSLTGYAVIFGLSSVCRVFAVLLLWRLSNVPVQVPHVVEGALALHPATNSMDMPILPTIPEEGEESEPIVATTPAAEAAVVETAQPLVPATDPATLSPRAA